MTLAPDELMAAAEAETGLTDYGSDSFRAGLERLTEALRSEAQLSELGSDIMRMRLIGHLANRLRVHDTVKRLTPRSKTGRSVRPSSSSACPGPGRRP